MNAPAGPVAHAILAQGAVQPTHRELASTGGFSERTVTNVVSDLARERLLVGGRPARLGPALGLAVGVSLGSESLRAGVVDANGELFAAVDCAPHINQLHEAPHHLLRRVRDAVTQTLELALGDERLWPTVDQPALHLVGVSVAWPSPVDRDGRPAGTALRHFGWRRERDRRTNRSPTLQTHVESVLTADFAGRCHALNDVNAQALALGFDAARARASDPDDTRWRVALIVRVGGGLGAGTIMLAPHDRRRLSFIDSRLIAGTNGLAGELGHLQIDETVIRQRNENNPFADLAPLDYEGATCSCGRHRHLEAFAGGTALVERLQRSGYEIPDDGRGRSGFLRAMLEGPLDDLQTHAVRDVGRILGRALAGPILMLDPYSVTLTGSLATPDLEDGVLRERDVWSNAVGDAVKVRSVSGQRGAFLGVRGAALAVLRRHVHRRLTDAVESRHAAGFEFTERHLAELNGVS